MVQLFHSWYITERKQQQQQQKHYFKKKYAPQ